MWIPPLALMCLHVYYSHLMGFFYRTIRIAENGIKPAYVFDGKPPDLKAGIVRLNLFSLTLCGTNGTTVVAGKTI
jgi:hypothetical protein